MDLYNDNDPGAAAWLRELIAGGHIPPGTVDDRSILDVRATELLGHRRVHLFAGIGGWAEALRLAAWPDAIPVWTGSPPCQPFSAAGKRAGRDDARHLGPAFVDLVRAARPPVLFGEQVASADVFGHAAKPGKRDRGGAPAWAWCDDLFLRLEAAGYAAWALDIPAAGIGAPHIRQRCFFAAVDLRFADGRMENPELSTGARQRRDGGEGLRQQEAVRPAGTGVDDGLDPAGGDAGLLQRDTAVGLEHGAGDGRQQRRAEPVWRGIARGRGACGLADAEFARVRPCGSRGAGSPAGSLQGAHGERQRVWPHAVAVDDTVGTRPGPTDGFWRDADWLFCRDGKWRPVGAGIQPLAHGSAAALDELRAIEVAALNEVENVCAHKGNPREVVRILREAICQGTGREEQTIGVRQQLHAPEVLLPFLLCLDAALAVPGNKSGFEKASAEVRRRIVRGVRDSSGHDGPSRGWGCHEQRSTEPSDALPMLSQLLALHAEAYRKAAISAHAASGRVAILRGAGNAIVPQAAAEAIAIARDTLIATGIWAALCRECAA